MKKFVKSEFSIYETYTESGRKGVTLLYQMVTDFQNSFNHRLSSKLVAKIFKYPTTPRTHRYTTLWNMCAEKVLKIAITQSWVKQDSAIQNSCSKERRHDKAPAFRCWWHYSASKIKCTDITRVWHLSITQSMLVLIM